MVPPRDLAPRRRDPPRAREPLTDGGFQDRPDAPRVPGSAAGGRRVTKGPQHRGEPAAGGGPETTVLLVRHGETEYNRTDRYMGRREDGLNDRGRDQAVRLARRLEGERALDALYTSPLARTRETASTLERALGLTAAPEPGFVELDVGVWEGRRRSDVAAEDPRRWRLWLIDPMQVKVEGMESGVDDYQLKPFGPPSIRKGASYKKVGRRDRFHPFLTLFSDAPPVLAATQ